MRVLVLTHRLPYAPNRGDRLRAYHVLQHLRTRADVELVSLVHDDDEAAHVDDVRAFVPHVTALRVPKWRTRIGAAGALATGRPVTHALLDAPGMREVLHTICRERRPDLVLAYCSGMARFALEPPLAGIPWVLDFVDVDSQKWRELADTNRPPLSWVYGREAATLGAFESRAATCAAASLVVNAREAAIARAIAPAANVQIIPNGVDIDRLRPLQPPSGRPQVAFCGVMNYAPNEAGMSWFVRQVWPLVRAERPDATLAIVGDGPTQAFRSLCSRDASVTVTGRVADVREWLWASAVGIAPLHVARGVQNKALEAVAAGLPIVVTEAVASGLPPEVAPASLVANTAERFAGHVLDLLRRSAADRRALAAGANLAGLTWSRTLAPLWPILERVAQTPLGAAAEWSRRLDAPHRRSA
jgi:sugar transferase (PEP-CTERM/EpsH1 system associated)